MSSSTSIEEPNNQDLYEHYKFTADNGQSPLRVDKLLMNFSFAETKWSWSKFNISIILIKVLQL